MLDFWHKVTVCIISAIAIPIVFIVLATIATVVLMGIKAVVC